MVQLQYSGMILIICILHLTSFPVGFTDSTKVILLTTEGATTDLKWEVENWNTVPGYPGWEDMSMPYKDKVLRGYQICEINHYYNNAVKPETWLLLPKVNINGTSRVYIEMNFTMRECRDLNKTCRETFSVFYRTSKEREDLIKFHPKQYKKIDTVAAEVRFSPNVNDTRMNHETVDISFGNASVSIHRYLHIAIVDAGACVALMGIRIYHKVCRKTIAGFATFQETKTGVSDTSLVPITGTCVPHSIYQDFEFSDMEDVSMKPLGPLYHCTSSGEWQVNTGMCECNAGYEPNDNRSQCIPCKKGMFKSSIGNKPCLLCPTNSGTREHGAVSCHCDAGYSAIMNHKSEPSSVDCHLCSRLPRPPQRLDASVPDLDNPGNVILSWRKPVDNGGCSKVWYYIFCSYASLLTVDTPIEDDKSCSHIDFLPSSREVNGLKVSVKNLRGHSTYNFTILAYTASSTSGMSDKLSSMLFGENKEGDLNQTDQVYAWWRNQELSNLLYHSSSHILHQTSDTLPSSVEDLEITMENETAIVISWKRPAFPNGKILFYSVSYSLDQEASLSFPLSSNASEMTQYGFSDLPWMSMQTNNTKVILTDLSPGSTYKIIVAVHNSAGSDNGSVSLIAETLPLTEKPIEQTKNSNSFPYIIATVIVASLIVLVFVVLLLQWKCKSDEKKGHDENVNGEAPAQFRPYNSQHNTLDQRTYVDPFCLDSLPNHQFLCETSPESITIGEVIGCGEFGEVYKGTLATIDLKTGQETTIDVAVKCLKNQCKPEEQKSFFQEARSLEKFRHPNVVHLEAVVTLTRPFIIVTELMANGSLLGFLTMLKVKSDAEQSEKVMRSPISYQTMVEMLRGVASGMEYLSSRGYVHRDLAARNVLVNSDMICKVADFGLLRALDKTDLDHGQRTYTTSGGKIAIKWTAPEAITFRTFTQFSDVWSFGILMWEAASFGDKPYWAHTNDEVIKAVNQGLRLPAPNRCPSMLHKLMLKCWQRDHNLRPTFTKIISELTCMLNDPTVLDQPASPASCGHPEMFFGDESNTIDEELDVPRDTENLLTHEEDINIEPVPFLGIDLHDLLPDSENELSDSDEGTIGSDTPDEDGSEVSSCTSTICASEITVCAGNGSATYVPLVRSEFDSDENESSRSCTPTGHYYTVHR